MAPLSEAGIVLRNLGPDDEVSQIIAPTGREGYCESIIPADDVPLIADQPPLIASRRPRLPIGVGEVDSSGLMGGKMTSQPSVGTSDTGSSNRPRSSSPVKRSMDLRALKKPVRLGVPQRKLLEAIVSATGSEDTKRSLEYMIGLMLDTSTLGFFPLELKG